jgi:methionyl aminopeptidase
MIEIKSEQEINLIRQAGRVVARVMEQLKKEIKPGVNTQELDEIAANLIISQGAVSAFYGYQGFPGNICTSINEEVVHGIPGSRVLKEGDIISLDIGVKLDGYYADSTVTLAVGKISSLAKKLLEVTEQALKLGIQQAISNNHLYDISSAVQNYVEAHGFSVVRDFVGHGIGSKMHEEPQIPNFGQAHKGPILRKGMVLAIEPMVNVGSYQVEITSNGWTAVTKDGSLSAHFEHTVVADDRIPEVLTKI